MNVTIYALLTEMETWMVFDPVHKGYAKNSIITNLNHSEFARLVNDWGNGYYDGDPQYVGEIICNILTRVHNITALSFGCKMR